MKKFMMYAAVFGKKDNFKRPEISDPELERILYTDLNVFENHVFYDVKKINLDHLDHLDSIKRNRLVKILIPDEIFDNYEYSLYMDYKHPTKIDFNSLLSRLEPGSDMLISKHKRRDCIYDEGLKCVELGKGDSDSILKQLTFYRSEGYPSNKGLYAAYWLFRRHTKSLREFMQLWWNQVEKYSSRDQISLPYVAWKHDMRISLNRR